MNPKDDDLDTFFKKLSINVIHKKNNTSNTQFLVDNTYEIQNNIIKILDNGTSKESVSFSSNINYEKNDEHLINQPISLKNNDQMMAGVVRHNMPCPPTQAISYTNFHVETSIEVISNRIFVGGLTENIREDDLTGFFQRYGKIQNSRIIRNNNNTSKGYGFVTFVDEASATKVKNLAMDDPDRFCIQNCIITVKDARKKGVTKSITSCAIPNFHVPSSLENSNQSISQQVYLSNECQSSIPLQSDGLIESQTGSPQQFLTPPQTPTNFLPPPPPPPLQVPSAFVPPIGYYQYPYQYQYPYNAYYQVNPSPYQIYQYTHLSQPQIYPYNLEDPNNGECGNDYDSEYQQTPIVTIESDDEC